jgi:hypothetical protein
VLAKTPLGHIVQSCEYARRKMEMLVLFTIILLCNHISNVRAHSLFSNYPQVVQIMSSLPSKMCSVPCPKDCRFGLSFMDFGQCRDASPPPYLDLELDHDKDEDPGQTLFLGCFGHILCVDLRLAWLSQRYLAKSLSNSGSSTIGFPKLSSAANSFLVCLLA